MNNLEPRSANHLDYLTQKDFIAWTFDTSLIFCTMHRMLPCLLQLYDLYWHCIFSVFFFPLQTTLLNHILTAHHGKRIAVIENEVCSS